MAGEPYRIKFYGTDYYVTMDTDGEALITDITGKPDVVSKEIGVYTINPIFTIEKEISTAGNYQIHSGGKLARKYIITTQRFKNYDYDYSEQPNDYEPLALIFGKNYIFLEIIQYKRNLHKTNYAIPVVLANIETNNKYGMTWFDLECEKRMLGVK